MCRRAIKLLILFACLGPPAMALAHAQSSVPVTQEQFASLQQAVHDAQSSGDNAWVLISRPWSC